MVQEEIASIIKSEAKERLWLGREVVWKVYAGWGLSLSF